MCCEETCTSLQNNSRVCVKYLIRTGVSWVLRTKPSHSERKSISNSGTYISSDDDHDDGDDSTNSNLNYSQYHHSVRKVSKCRWLSTLNCNYPKVDSVVRKVEGGLVDDVIECGSDRRVLYANLSSVPKTNVKSKGGDSVALEPSAKAELNSTKLCQFRDIGTLM